MGDGHRMRVAVIFRRLFECGGAGAVGSLRREGICRVSVDFSKNGGNATCVSVLPTTILGTCRGCPMPAVWEDSLDDAGFLRLSIKT